MVIKYAKRFSAIFFFFFFFFLKELKVFSFYTVVQKHAGIRAARAGSSGAPSRAAGPGGPRRAPLLLRAGPEAAQPTGGEPLVMLDPAAHRPQLIMESSTHVRPCVRGAGSRVAPTCAHLSPFTRTRTERTRAITLLDRTEWKMGEIEQHIYAFCEERTHARTHASCSFLNASLPDL